MASHDIFSKHLPTVKLATRCDAEGREIQVERREDADAILKEQETYDMLVAAGYYRAKISGLSAFDKVVGGMTWCIECCDYGVDVDLLFHENLTIGQKIALVEKIVYVLPQMKCPYVIEPHQIQGLEFFTIHPVIQWLVKTSVENRGERAQRLKKYATNQYYSNFQYALSKEDMDKIKAASNKTKEVKPPQNVFKLKAEEKLQRQQHYKDLQLEMEYGSEVISQQSQLRLLESTELILSRQVKEGEEQAALLKKQLEEEEHILEELEKEANSIKAEVEEYENKEKSIPQELLNKVQSLILENEELKKEESEFKEFCRKDIETLTKQIEELEICKARGAEGAEATESREELEIKELKLRIAKRNRAILSIQRQLDAVLDPMELAQYQKRFLELYNEMSAKHLETKQYYASYNTLSDQKNYLEKELSLLNNICDTYAEKNKYGRRKEEFVKQLEQALDGVLQTEAKVSQKYNEVLQEREALNEELKSLHDLQRQYAAAVKQFTKECQRYEQLQQHLKLIKRKP